jgi:hypothetical protein
VEDGKRQVVCLGGWVCDQDIVHARSITLSRETGGPILDCSPQSRTRYNFLYDGLCKDGQEKIESVIGLRRNGRLGVLQRSLVVTYNLKSGLPIVEG